MNIHFEALTDFRASGANAYLLEVDGTKILLDCGASPADPSAAWIDTIDAPDMVFVTHAHWDHAGGLPRLSERFPHVPIAATPATRTILAPMLESGLTGPDADLRSSAIVDTVRALKFHESLTAGGQHTVRITPIPCGHIPGAASCLVETQAGEERFRLAYTGDFCLHELPCVEGLRPEELADVDVLVMEGALATERSVVDVVPARELLRLVRDVGEKGPAVLAVSPFGEALDVCEALHRAETRYTIHDSLLRPLRAFMDSSRGEPFELPEALTTSRCKKMLDAGSVVVAPGDQLERGTPAGDLARRIAPAPGARIAVFNSLHRGSFAELLIRTPRRSRAIEGAHRFRLRARVGHYLIPRHASRPQLRATVGATSPRRLILVHNDADALHDLRRDLEKTGFAGHIDIASERVRKILR